MAAADAFVGGGKFLEINSPKESKFPPLQGEFPQVGNH